MLGALALPAFTTGISGVNAHLEMPSLAAIRGDISAVWAWLTGYSPPPPWGKLPTEPSGTAAGHPHEVSAAMTRANRGNGHAPGKVPSGLPPYEPLKPKVAHGLSGRAVTGYSARTSVRVAGRSTATSDYYQNADGSVTRTLAAAPINYEASPGNWMPINPALVRAAGGRWQEKANSVQVSVGGSAASADLLSVGLSGHVAAAVGLAGAAPVTPAVSGATITYRGVLPATDLMSTATTSGVTSSLVLHSARAPSSWVLPLRLTGLRPELTSGGAVSLIDASGSRVAVIPPATATDAASATSTVSYRLTTHDGAPALLMTLPAGWLNAAARQFPVTVETGVSAYQDTAEGTTFADTTLPGDNSTSQTIAIGARDGGTEKANSFLEFPDLGLQGSGVDVMSAALRLSLVYATTCGAEPFDVAAVTQPWTPSTVTSYPGPPHGAAIGSLSTPLPARVCGTAPADPSASDRLTVGLSTSTFQGWADDTTPNNGLEVYAPTAGNLHWKQFTSVYSEFPPVLVLTYAGVVLPVVSAQAPPNGTVANTLTPRLTAYGQVDSGLGRKPEFEFQIENTSGATVADSGLIPATTLGTSSFFGPASWTVPAGKLQWGQPYFWTVQAYDGTNFSPGAVWNSLTVQVPQPVITSLLSQNTSGHGIDPVVGNYTTSATDADVATVGPSLTVERDYNSLDPRMSGAFGAGWSTIFDAKATEQFNDAGGVSSVVVTNPDGSAVGFGKNPNGTFSPPEGTFSTLRSVSGGGYTFTDKNDTVYSFRQSLGSGSFGITSVTDAEGRSVDFTWSGGQLTTMTSVTSGRALHLTWTMPNGAKYAHVASVTTDPVTAGDPSTALTWTYGYNADQLTSVCAPGSYGRCTQYSYTLGSDFYDTVLDQDPQSYWPLSETTGTTAHSAVLAHEGSDNGTYSNVTLGQPGPLAPPGTGTAAGFNGTSSSVALPNLYEGSMPDQTIALWFKTTKPGVLFSYSDDPIAACPPPQECGTLFDPALYIGSDGKLNASLYEHVASSGTVPTIETSAPVDDGKWHFAVLTGSAAQQVLYVSGLPGSTGITRVGTGPGATVVGYTTGDTHLTHVYLGAGFLGGLWPDQPSHNVAAAPVSYFDGSIADAAFYNSPLSASGVNLLYQAGATAASLLSNVTRPSGSVYAMVAYDPLTARVTSFTDENGGTWKLSAPSVSGSSQVYRTAVLNSHPADYYRLGDPAGTAVALNQVSGGTARYFDVMLGVPGRFSDSTAASFNGSSSYLDMPPGLVTGHGDQSISLWFKTTKPGTVLFGSSQAALASGSTTANYAPELYIGANGQLEGEFPTGTAKPITSRAAVDDGQWHYVVLAAGTTSQVMYLDGVEAGTVTGHVQGTGETNAYVGSGFISGQWPNSPHPGSGAARPAYFDGSIGDVAFYDTQLSKTQALSEFQAAQGSNGMTPVTTVTLTDPGGKLITDQYDPLNANRMVATTDALGHRTTYGYDTSGYLHTVTNPDGDVSTTVSDPRGNVIATTTCQDQAANKCSTVYQTYYPNDTAAQLTPDPRNDQVLTIRDGRSTSATDPTYETSYTYDSHGNVTAVTTPPVPGFPHGQTTSVTYSNGTSAFPAADSGNVPAGLPVKTVSPGGATQTVSYFHDGDVAKTTNADGLVTRYTYDNLGRVLTETQFSGSFPQGLATSYTYDGQNRVLTETDPPVTNMVTGVTHTAETSTVYDPDGDILSQKVADLTGWDRPRTVRYTYTRYDQVATSTDADGNTTSYTYDAYGNKATETDPNGNETAYTYDPNGNPLDTILINFTGNPADPTPPIDLVESSHAYDPADRLASITDAMGNTTTYTYTDNGLLATTTKSNASGTSHYVEESESYDAAGNLISSVTANGATVTDYTVDAANRNTGQVLDPNGVDRTTTVSYNPDDLPAVTTQTSPPGATEVTSQTYDPMGNVTSRTVYSVTNGHSSPKLTTTWTLDQRGLPTSSTDPDGNVTTYVYDAAGKLAQTSQPAVPVQTDGGPTVMTHPVSMTGYNTFGNQTQTKDPDGNVTTTAFDGNGNVVAQTLPSYTPPGSFAPIRATTTNVYDGDGNLVKQTDPLGNVTTNVYGQLGDLTSSTAPDGGVNSYTYDNDGNETSVTGPTGSRIQYTYDYLDRMATSTVLERYPSPEAEVTTYSYTASASDPGGAWLSSETSQDGVTTSYGYDAVGEETSQTDGAGNTTSYRYDFLGRQTAVILPDGTSQTTSYDVLGDPVTADSLNASGSVLVKRTATYNGNGDMLSETDPRGDTTTFSYDATGLLSSEVQPVSATSAIATSFGYDAAGNETRFTDGRGNSWIYTYNPWNLQQSEIEPSTSAYPDATDSTFTTAYDADGRPVTQAQPGGVTITDSYDSVGDLTGQSGWGADAPTASRTFGYNLAGDLTSASTSGSEGSQDNSGGSQGTGEQFTYNDRGELLTANGSAGDSSFSYTGDGLVRTATTAAGTTGYTYDVDDRLATVTDPATGTILDYGYNDDSELTSIKYGLSGDAQTYGYNSLHELTSDSLTTPSGATAASITYGYDADGNLTSKDTTSLAGASDNTYTYDEANRLTSWDNGTTTTDYAYDASSNRTQAGDTTYTYDARDELTSGGGVVYGYTANGTLATTTDANGTVNSAFDAYGQQITDGTERYTYDALDRDISVTTKSQHDQGTTPQDGQGATAQLTYAGTSDDISSDGTSTYTWTPGGTLTGIGVAYGTPGDGVLAMTDLHTDVVGDFTASGGLTGSTAYDPLGNVITTSGTPAGKLGYQSDLTDPVTGKVEMGDRWYNPANGNFTSRDASAGSPNPNSVAANPFAYAGDSPLVNIDPTGNCWFVCSVVHAVTSVVHRVVHTVKRVVSHVVNTVKSVARAAARVVVKTVVDVVTTTVEVYREAAHVVAQTATKLYNGAKQLASTAWHATVSVAKAGATFLKAHATAIASFAASAAVFIGCDALTAGVGTIGCAAAAGAVGNLVSYGLSCGSSTGGCTVGGALTSALSGAAAGAVGYVLGGPFGGKIASDLLGDVLPSVAIRGLTGAIAGAAAGSVANATSYAGGCLQGDQCSWSGFGGAVASGAAGGAVTGGLLGAVTPESPSESPADPAATGDPGTSGNPDASPEGEPTSSDDGGSAKANAESADGSGEPEEQSEGPQSCRVGGQSFTAGTKVLLASGAAIAISKLKVGDKVLATNTKAGKTQAEKVTAVLVHYDTDLYDVTVKSGGHTEVIHTTSNHLFWDPYLKQWVPAGKLHKTEHLKTADSTAVTADGGTIPAQRDGWMWDLTVPGNNDHDFYVRIGSTSVLVHNCSASAPKPKFVWKNGRVDANGDLVTDTTPQGTLPADAGLRPGTSPTVGEYHYVVNTDGSLRVMGNEDMWDLNPDAGHTSLAGYDAAGQPNDVLMAGTFNVNEAGEIDMFDNLSGHYRPGVDPAYNENDYMPLEQVAREAFADFGLPAPLPGAWSPVWMP